MNLPTWWHRAMVDRAPLTAAATIASGKPPSPPAGLSPAAAKLWKEIVAARPAGYFDAGNLPLLKSYVVLLDILEKADVGSATHRRLLSSAVNLATKLRLTVQANVHRRAGILDEKPRPAPFLGGSLVTFRRPNDV